MDFTTSLAALVAGRLILAYSSIPSYVEDHHLLSSPLSAFSRLKEGLYLYENDVDPYSGGPCYHSPLYLSLFSTILPTSTTLIPFLWTLVDAIAAWALVNIWRARQGRKETERDHFIAALYLLNPYLVFPSLAYSTSTFENALQLLSLMFGSRGNTSASLLTLSFLIHLSPTSLIILPPTLMLLLILDPSSHLANPRLFPLAPKDALPRLRTLLGSFLGYSTVLACASTLIAGGTGWISRVWGAPLLLPDLTPNVGLWWYFFTEMFDHFRPFFLIVFSMHLIIYTAPLCIKFQHDPLYAAFLLLGVLGAFKPYPTLADPGLFLTMIGIFPETFAYLRYPIVTALLHLHSALLLPLFHQLWLVQGTGNANFFYASTLVFGVSNGAALADCIWAGLRIAVGEVGEGRQVIQE
ncbi:cell division cycle protein 91 [Punctularia strigosozonata HHB-11173 SS5]|uniref:cell division cycle protein 91 n=1 Tax=Punctularia strigosozonata (strain HHB-11173) TaxID=741275 RepID=UPI0004417DBD|nr:cell division cycle protein 91 [Punctularia strigosozonata HHB-11173 SS5]EIN11521.1 cell division cycle protein 91 [Punctularia strigosozonata HHB-11173 SS5]